MVSKHGCLTERVKAQLGKQPLASLVVAQRAKVSHASTSVILRRLVETGQAKSSEVFTNGRRKARYWVD